MRLNSEAKYVELKEQLYHLCGIKPDRILLAEVAASQIKSLLADDAKINPATATELYAYELPGANVVVPTAEIENETGLFIDGRDKLIRFKFLSKVPTRFEIVFKEIQAWGSLTFLTLTHLIFLLN